MVGAWLRRFPVVGRDLARLCHALSRNRAPGSGFAGSAAYWEQRYEAGSDSGRGSYGKYARFKANTLNEFVAEHHVASVIEFGCGDGNQLALAEYPRYVGLDVSESAVAVCRQRFLTDPTKTFRVLQEYAGERAELALSLDVIYHLVEDDVFATHIRMLFAAAERFVIVYSTNAELSRTFKRMHVRHRRFTDFVTESAADWELRQQIRSPYARGRARAAAGKRADFFVFGRSGIEPTNG